MAKVVSVLSHLGPNSTASEDANPLTEDGVVAIIDLDEDGRRMHRAVLLFATYGGLQTEYQSDSGTTVLNAALDTYLGALGATDDENLASSYAGFLSHTATWTP